MERILRSGARDGGEPHDSQNTWTRRGWGHSSPRPCAAMVPTPCPKRRVPPESGLSEKSPRRGMFAGVRYHSPLYFCSSARMAQFIYTMNRVSKVVPPKRVILRDISLSFFPGAKIGVLGLNGSGKSTLLRIMAGVDKEFEG